MKLKIISDGTNAGTKLINEDTGESVEFVQKISWEVSAKDFTCKAIVDFINIPVEITSKTEVQLHSWDPKTRVISHSKTFEKEIKILGERKGKAFSPFVTIRDVETNELVGAIQELKWEATPDGTKAIIKKLKFGKSDW